MTASRVIGNGQEDPEPSPSLSRGGAEDSLSNSEGPLLTGKQHNHRDHEFARLRGGQMHSSPAMLLRQASDGWRKGALVIATTYTTNYGGGNGGNAGTADGFGHATGTDRGRNRGVGGAGVDNGRGRAGRAAYDDEDEDESDGYEASKSKIKPNANAEKKSNEKKTGRRGVWLLAVALASLGSVNLLLNLAIFVVLRLGQGMEALELVRDGNLIKFYGNTDLDRVCLHNSICQGFGDDPIELSADGAGVSIGVSGTKSGGPGRLAGIGSKLQILGNGTSISHVDAFRVRHWVDPDNAQPTSENTAFFTTDFPNFGLPQGVHRVELEAARTHRVVAPKNADLALTSGAHLGLYGAEGASLDAAEIHWSAEGASGRGDETGDILLRSTGADIVLEAKQAIQFARLPQADPAEASDEEQYKVCVCMPSGKLFLVPDSERLDCAWAARRLPNDPCDTSVAA